MIRRSDDGKTRVLSLSYGKDSMACLGALEELDWPLDRIVTADVWATDTIPADLPPMVEFKDYADRIILERYGIEVEHYRDDATYEERFFKIRGPKAKHRPGQIYGFPFSVIGAWCSITKISALRKCRKSYVGGIEYLGIAADEPDRFRYLSDEKLSPLVEIGWTEKDCRAWCEREGLLSPIYKHMARGGCWFCNNQGVEQLRLLRRQYPELWALLLKWDADSPVSFKPDGHTVHDFDRRFALEDGGLIDEKAPFRWEMLTGDLQMNLFKEAET